MPEANGRWQIYLFSIEGMNKSFIPCSSNKAMPNRGLTQYSSADWFKTEKQL